MPCTVHPKVAPRHVEEFRESGMNRAFPNAAWNCFKAKGIDLRTISSIEEQDAFVQDLTDCHDEGETEANDADEDRDSKGVVSTVEVTTSEVRGKLKQNPASM